MTVTGEEFTARNVARWTVDGTAITMETDADMPPGVWRKNMRQDLAAYKSGDRLLACVHMTASFLGQSGTAVHGRGWKMHTPQGDKRFELWGAAEYASEADWTEWPENKITDPESAT